MTDREQPEALQLAEYLEKQMNYIETNDENMGQRASSELRRLNMVNQMLLGALEGKVNPKLLHDVLFKATPTKQARLAQPEQKPVGEIVQAFEDLTAVSIPVMPPVGTKLYTTPPSIEAAVLAEREACVKVCEEVGPKEGPMKLVTDGFVAAIRARGEK